MPTARADRIASENRPGCQAPAGDRTAWPRGGALLILLSVVDEGLGAVFFGIQPGIMDAFRGRFGVPAEWTPIGAIAIGYPDPASDPVGTPSPSLRKSLDDLVHEGRW